MRKWSDEALIRGKERFLLHYNFPPFSTGGEARASRGVGRREVGHGNLALRALKNMIPADYPYVVRVVSDILESNGFVVDGNCLRRNTGFDGCGVQIKNRFRYCHGIISKIKEKTLLYFQISLATKITLAIWTSKLPEQKTVSLLLKWTLKLTDFLTKFWNSVEPGQSRTYAHFGKIQETLVAHAKTWNLMLHALW